jgi:hypothetical protein
MASMVVPVWVDDWQQECCGDPLVVGARVAWTLVACDDFVVDALGDAMPAWTVEAHPDGTGTWDERPGVVLRRGGLAVFAAEDDQAARTIRMPAQERHSDLEGVPPTTGRIMRVRHAACRHDPVDGEPDTWSPAPGTCVLTGDPVPSGFPEGPERFGLFGYVVDLEVDA